MKEYQPIQQHDPFSVCFWIFLYLFVEDDCLCGELVWNVMCRDVLHSQLLQILCYITLFLVASLDMSDLEPSTQPRFQYILN